MAIPLNRPSGSPEKKLPGTTGSTDDFVLPSFDFSFGEPSSVAESGGKKFPKHFSDDEITAVPESSDPFSNPFDNDDEDGDPFSSIDLDDEELYSDDSEEVEIPSVAASNPTPSSRKGKAAAPAPVAEVIAASPSIPTKGRRFGRKDKTAELPKGHTEDTFIDEKEVKLKPYGSGRGRKIKVSDFDTRKNMKTNAVIVRTVVIAVILAMFGLVVKTAFFPPQALTESEIAQIAASTVGDTGFPMEKGGAFVEQFMKAYLTIDFDDVNSKRALSFFYNGGDMSAEVDIPSRAAVSNFKQSIIIGPTLYESVGLTDYSARYTVGAFVESSLKDSEAPADGSSAKWSFFNVNVYYDKVSDGFVITPDSPSIIPAVDVIPQTKLPLPGKIGTGTVDADLTEKLKPVVYGFVKGYAISNAVNHDSIDQYIINDPPVELLKGLDKRYTIAGEDSSAISFEAFPTTNANEVKVSVKIRWRDSLSSQAQVDYTSNYIMTLQKQSNDKYLVSKFAPLYYVASDS